MPSPRHQEISFKSISEEVMLSNKNWIKVKWVGVCAAGAIALFGYAFLSSPGSLVLSKSGEPIGLLNQLRLSIQGREFWRDQLGFARSELKRRQDEPSRKMQREKRLKELEQRLEARMESHYQKFPNSRPTNAELQADALRAEADRIEDEEFDASREAARLKRIDELVVLIRLIEDKI